VIPGRYSALEYEALKLEVMARLRDGMGPKLAKIATPSEVGPPEAARSLVRTFPLSSPPLSRVFCEMSKSMILVLVATPSVVSEVKGASFEDTSPPRAFSRRGRGPWLSGADAYRWQVPGKEDYGDLDVLYSPTPPPEGVREGGGG
jgi:hypothetical protein